MINLANLDQLDWREFEHLCLVLFEHDFKAADANFYGANCYGQNGIDIRLTTVKGGTRSRVVVQCKRMDSLDWSDFKEDLKHALETFAREAVEEDRDFWFIVATTAEIGNTKKFDASKDALVLQLGLADIKGRIKFDVYTGPRLRIMATQDKVLREFFARPERDADKYRTQDLTDLGVRLTRCADRNELAKAQRAISDYLRTANPSDAESYNWVPSDLFDQIAYLTLAAGDFERANKLLNAALGVDPLYARYHLGSLRARRVLHAAPWSNLPRTIFEQLPRIPSPAEDVDVRAPKLLAALGETDQQLTLALWVVSYASTRELSEQGLSRALGLVTQAWPQTVERLEKDVRYKLSDDGYFDRFVRTRREKRPQASSEHLRACALAVAYCYIRDVHMMRFGERSMLDVEAAHDGWPVAIDGIARSNSTGYFSALKDFAERAMRAHLPSLLEEGAGREYGVEHVVHTTLPPPPRLDANVYVAAPLFLLRDCENGVVEGRIEELKHGGFMVAGATILISHLGLERLVQVQLGDRLGLNRSRTREQSSAMVDAIDLVLSRLQRSEPGGSTNQRPPFESRPCYADFRTEGLVNRSGSSIELARGTHMPFLMSSVAEYRVVSAELPPADKHLYYWLPVTSSAGAY